MSRFRYIVVVALLLVWSAMPAMACLTPKTLTPEESRCCKQMAGACHQTSAKHSCCPQVAPQDVASLEARQIAVVDAAVPVAPITTYELQVAGVYRATVFFSPPHSPPATTSTLRI